MASPFIYAELHSNDVQRARQFYARLFDWKITEVHVPGKYYAEIGPGEGFPGGLTAALPEHEKFTGWLSYVKVKDLTALCILEERFDRIDGRRLEDLLRHYQEEERPRGRGAR